MYARSAFLGVRGVVGIAAVNNSVPRDAERSYIAEHLHLAGRQIYPYLAIFKN